MPKPRSVSRIDPYSLPPFDGFGADVFGFFEELARNQSREWYAEHREVYETQAHRPMIFLLAALIEALGEAGTPLRGDPVASVFRIHRDIRFSKDKSPYKTHIAAALTRSGRRDDPAVFYIHVAPERCFAAAGFHHPPAETLDAIRSALVREPERYRKVAADLAAAGLEFSREHALTRPPRGYEGEHPEDVAAGLRLKSFVVTRDLDRDDVLSPRLVSVLTAFARDSGPVHRLA